MNAVVEMTRQPTFSDMWITPELAAKYLSLNNHNRVMSASTARLYAAQMRNGMWKFNGDPIRIASDGTLIDGQHRLQAVVDSGIPMRAVVVTGLPRDVFYTVDVGKKRNAADALSISGFANVNILSGGARQLMVYESGAYWNEKADRTKWAPTPSQIVEYVETHPNLPHYLRVIESRYKTTFKLMGPSVALMAYALAADSDQEKANEFFEGLSSGVISHEYDPRHMLRELLITNRIKAKRPMRQYECVGVTIKALNAWFKGAQIKHLSFRTQGQKVEKFPKFVG